MKNLIRQGKAILCNLCAHKGPKIWDARGRLTLEERFWQMVDKSPGQGPNGDCWGWKGSTTFGYGQLGRYKVLHGTNTPMRAHVLSYQIHFGVLPEGMTMVCHHCDNPPCTNPDHLFPGNARINVRDAQMKGRMPIRDLALIKKQKDEAQKRKNDEWLLLVAKAMQVGLAIVSASRRRIFFAYYQDERRSLQSVANELGITRERVRQIISQYPLDLMVAEQGKGVRGKPFRQLYRDVITQSDGYSPK